MERKRKEKVSVEQGDRKERENLLAFWFARLDYS